MKRQIEDRYPEFSKWDWKSFSDSKRIVKLDDFLKINIERGRIFHIGSDSKEYGNKTLFATALIAHNTNCGGEIIIHKDKTSSYPSLRAKLVMEAMRTLEVAWYLDAHLPSESKIRIHLDVNDNIDWKSGQYKEELVGLIMGQGYVSYRDVKNQEHKRIVFWKPDSWAAMKVADKKTKKN